MNSVVMSPLVCVRFLESQLRNQCSQTEEELEALRCQLSQAIFGSSSAAQQQVSGWGKAAMEDSEERLFYGLKQMVPMVPIVFVSAHKSPFLPYS